MPDHHTSPVGEEAERADVFDAEAAGIEILQFLQKRKAPQGMINKLITLSCAAGGYEAIRRAAPALDASGLPPLPAPAHRGPTGTGAYFDSYTTEQVRQAQRDAVASRDAEIADLRAQLAATTAKNAAVGFDGAAPTQPKAQAGTILTDEFRKLLNDYADWTDDETEAALVTHIDAWAGSRAGDAVPDGWKLVPEQPTNKMTAIGQDLRYKSVNSIGAIYRAMLAAAPAPGKQAGNDQDVST